MKLNYKKIKEFALIHSGTTPSTSKPELWNGNIKWITPAELDNGHNWYVYDTQRKITDIAVSDKSLKLLKPGTVLLTSRAPIGKVALVGEPMCTNQGFKNIECDTNIMNPEFLYFWLLGKNEYLNSLGRGATFKEISKTIVENIVVPVPKLEIQNKVVLALKQALSLIDKRKAQIEALDQLTQSVFLEMFGDPGKNPKKWPIGTIQDLTLKTQYGTSKKADENFGKYPILRMNNITYSGYWDFNSLKYIDLDEKEAEKYLVYKGELLFNRTNSKELVGKAAVFHEEKPMAYAGYLVKLIPNDKANTEFIAAYLNSRYGKALLLSMAKNIVGMANINAEELKGIKIYIPPKDLQDKFATVIKNILEKRELLLKGLNELENNYHSLMQRVFKGELFHEEKGS
jgi:type I restriction enzyme S subunit